MGPLARTIAGGMALPIALAALTACSTSEEFAAPAQSSRVDQIVDELARPFSVSMPAGGLSIGIVAAGETQTFHYGQVDRLGPPPTDSTLYTVGSITKTFTATLLAQAVIAGHVGLTDDIRDYLDGDYPNLAYDSQPIRLVHLANHRSGLPAHLPPMPPHDSGRSEIERTTVERAILNSYTRSDFLRDLRRVELTSVPGSQFRYSNAGTLLLAHILERVYGRSYEELVETNIALPLGMGSTTFDTISNGRRPAGGYNADGVVVPNNGVYMSAAAGMQSTVADMLRYARWQLEDADPAVALTHEPTWSSGGTYSIGLNWQMFHLPNFRVIWEQGSLPGYTSYLVVYPELDLGIVALMNVYDEATSSGLTALVKSLTSALDHRAAELP